MREEHDEWESVENLNIKLMVICQKLTTVEDEDGWLDKERTLKRLRSSAQALAKVIEEIEMYESRE